MHGPVRGGCGKEVESETDSCGSASRCEFTRGCDREKQPKCPFPLRVCVGLELIGMCDCIMRDWGGHPYAHVIFSIVPSDMSMLGLTFRESRQMFRHNSEGSVVGMGPDTMNAEAIGGGDGSWGTMGQQVIVRVGRGVRSDGGRGRGGRFASQAFVGREPRVRGWRAALCAVTHGR